MKRKLRIVVTTSRRTVKHQTSRTQTATDSASVGDEITNKGAMAGRSALLSMPDLADQQNAKRDKG